MIFSTEYHPFLASKNPPFRLAITHPQTNIPLEKKIVFLRRGGGNCLKDVYIKYFYTTVDSRQISLEASWMLLILDLISLAHLAGCERYESKAIDNEAFEM